METSLDDFSFWSSGMEAIGTFGLDEPLVMQASSTLLIFFSKFIYRRK